MVQKYWVWVFQGYSLKTTPTTTVLGMTLMAVKSICKTVVEEVEMTIDDLKLYTEGQLFGCNERCLFLLMSIFVLTFLRNPKHLSI